VAKGTGPLILAAQPSPELQRRSPNFAADRPTPRFGRVSQRHVLWVGSLELSRTVVQMCQTKRTPQRRHS
jgi:hypothetical protein